MASPKGDAKFFVGHENSKETVQKLWRKKMEKSEKTA